MSRHSKNANSRQFFTSGEREKEKGVYGSKRMRLDAAAQNQFDQCRLCLGQVEEPVATPAGFLYCRECILENLVVQRAALEEQQRAHDGEARQRAARDEAGRQADDLAVAAAFIAAETGVASARGELTAAEAQEAAVSAAKSSKRQRMDQRTHEEKVADAQAVSPWLPSAAPFAPARATAAPEAGTVCPASGTALRAKQLVTVHLTPVAQGAGEGGAGGSGSASSEHARFMCPACLKPIVHQRTLLLTACGHVTCADCCAKFVVPSKACFLCSTRVVGRAQVVPLQVAGSGFAGHVGTQAEATRFAPSLLA